MKARICPIVTIHHELSLLFWYLIKPWTHASLLLLLLGKGLHGLCLFPELVKRVERYLLAAETNVLRR